MSPLKKGRIWLRIIAKRNTLVDEMIVLSRFKSQYIMRRHHQRKHGVKGECGECGKKVANLGRAPHPSHVGYNSVYESCTKSCFAEPLPSGSEFLRIRLLRWFAGLPSIMEKHWKGAQSFSVNKKNCNFKGLPPGIGTAIILLENTIFFIFFYFLFID